MVGKLLKKISALLLVTSLFLILGVVTPGTALAQPYVGEIRMFAGNFAPAGWALCQGQMIDIYENDTLFTLIGTTYGGDGITTFALPDLRGRAPIHMGQGPGNNYVIGEQGGVETVTLTTNQTPIHGNGTTSTDPGTTANPQGGGSAKAVLDRQELNIYSTSSTNTVQGPQAGGSQPHENMQPFLVINYIISLYGVFPSQT